MHLLEVRGLKKYYGRRLVVDGVQFEVNPGEVVGLLGPNGAGKTTTFRMTTGQITPFAGSVIFNGQDVTRLPMYQRARLGMGYLAQEPSIFRKLTVEQNVLAILEMLPVVRSLGRALTSAERHERTNKVLDQFGLTRLRKNVAMRLSGGEKRRLEIARCLVCEPLLILLDEPFTGIDPITIADIRQIVHQLRDSGIGILLTDHNVREALRITTRSYLIKDGKVRTHGTPQQIIHDPIAISEYLGAGFNDNLDGSPGAKPSGPFTCHRCQQESALPATPRKEVPPSPPSAARPVTLDFSTPPPPKTAGTPLQAVLEQERIQRLVEGLKTPDAQQAAAELMQRGQAALPILLAALERRDVELRRQAVQVLQALLQRPVLFDPYAPEALRRQQLAALRDHVERKAG